MEASNGQAQTAPQGRRGQRQWEVLFQQGLDEEGMVRTLEDRDEVRQALVDCEAIGHRLGGGFQVAPLRQAAGVDAKGRTRYETIGWAFEWVSFMPAVGERRPEPEEAPEPEPEPVVTEQ